MKYSKVAAFSLLVTITLSTILKAEEIHLPVITRPIALEEGTQRVFSEAQINELTPWAKDSKIALADLLENISSLGSTDKVERLIDGIKSIVGESSPKNSELFMRYVLNRSLVLHNILESQLDMNEVGSIDTDLRLLILSVNLAIKYCDVDMENLTKKTPAPFALFGFDYFKFLSELNKSIFDASAGFEIGKISLEWLAWDLYRDLNNKQYAPEIIKLNNSLINLSKSKISDKQSLSYIKQMKKTSQVVAIAISGKGVAMRRDNNKDLFKEFHVGNRIVVRKVGDKYHHLKIQAIYDDGSAFLIEADTNYTHGTFPLYELSYLKESSGRFKVGDAVIRKAGDKSYFHLKIKHIYEDGNAFLIDGTSGYYHGIFPLSDLSVGQERLGKFKKGDIVIRKDADINRQLRITFIYEDGYVYLTDTYTNYGQGVFPVSELSLRVE